MTEADQQEVRRIVQDEILGILSDAKSMLGMKDPTGFAKKALDGLTGVIHRRQEAEAAPAPEENSQPAG